MAFSDVLNGYVTRLGCTGRELAEAAGLSAAIISRYRAGERTPAEDSPQVRGLAAGIAALAAEKGDADASESAVYAELSAQLGGPGTDKMAENLNALIAVLDISSGEIARALNFDASYISRIRSGERRPADQEAFADGVCDFVARRFRRDSDRSLIAGLIGCSGESISEQSALLAALKTWLCSGGPERTDYVGGFLSKLDAFDLNEYIRSIHFDELRVPTAPFQLPTSRMYYGLREMETGELDFFRATVLSHSMDPVFMCSDMPMEDMAADEDFPKKWMYGLAMTLKKGLHLNIVHNIDRPFAEMMLGLESWIPMYMTGQISPYYLRGTRNGVYCHLDYVSGAAALTGDCIAGSHGSGRYYLTNSRAEMAFYRKKAEDILKKAQPLMDIYRPESKQLFAAFLAADAETEGVRHNILTSPPIYTLPERALDEILKSRGASESDRAAVLAFAAGERGRMETILEHGSVLDELHRLTAEEFERFPAVLSLTGMFCGRDIRYTYEEYVRHIGYTEEYAAPRPNYTADLRMERAFRNIQISIHEDRWAMVSKGDSPVVHFVIRQPKLRGAIQNMIMPVVE